MNKKRYLKTSLFGLTVLGMCVTGVVAKATAGQFVSPNKKLALELINPSKGLELFTPPISFKLDNGYPGGAKITITLNGAKFTNAISDGLTICYNGANATETITGGVNNATVTFTMNSTSIPTNQWLVLGSGTDCKNNFKITILGSLNDGDVVTISASVDPTGEQVFAGTLYTIKQQIKAIYQETKNYITYEHDLKKFKEGTTSSNAVLYVNSIPLDIPASNGNFTIKITGNDFTGVSGGSWGNCTLSLNPDKTALINDACPLSSVSAMDTKLTINVSGNETLSPRKFYTTLKTKTDGNEFNREITLLDNVLTHEWDVSGTTFFIPFIRHNTGLGIYTTIKLQAAKSGNTDMYPVYAEVIKTDGTPQQVTVCNNYLKAGNTCVITGDILTAAAGKEETMAKIYVNAPEDAIGCYIGYTYQGQLRRIPCKVKDGKIVE